MRIETDNPAVTQALDALRRVVLAEGGAFSPALRTVECDGALSIRADPWVNPKTRAMQVPESCLPPTDAVELTEREGRLALAGATRELPEVTRTCLDRLLDVYNACGQLAAWRRSTPWLTLAGDVDLLSELADLRVGAAKVKRFGRLFDQGAMSTLAVESFVDSRHAAIGARNGTVFMPFIDFLNHDVRARSYQLSTDRDGVRRLWTYPDRPVSGRDECFVRYGAMDAVDTFLEYGFVDESAPFLKSAPLAVGLPDGRSLTVTAAGDQPFRGQLPRGLQNLRFFVPPILSDLRGPEPAVARLVIPGPNAPWALRRVLRFLIVRSDPRLGSDAVERAVGDAERQVLEANERHIAAIEQHLASAWRIAPAAPPAGRRASLEAAERLVAKVRERLDGYVQRLGLPAP